jgi:RHS repeat-associated protein
MQTLLSDYQVGYAANLTLGSIAASMPGAPAAYSGTTSYSHDTKLQLTNETSTRGGGYNFSNVFDGAGGCPLGATTFKGAANTFNNANQNTAWTHDGNGNPTTYGGQTLAFDAENRMTAYGSVLTAGYRADGLRAWKQTSGGRTYYLYDGDQPVEELDASGNKAAVTTFGPSGVLARTTASRTLLYSFDALGQMAQQIDAVAGTIVASYLFDAWGARQVSTSDPTAASDPYSGYNTAAGYITDWETGLQLLGHRYYDPATGRFLNRDPIGMAGGINVYEYVSNSPLGSADTAGLSGNAAAVGGSFMGAGLSCLFTYFQSLIDIGRGSICAAAVACVLFWNCLVGAVASFLSAGIGILNPNAPAVLVGCLAGAAAGMPGFMIQAYCNSIAPCGPKFPGWDSPLCNFIKTVESTLNGLIAGCVGGLVNEFDPFDPIGGNMLGGMIGGLVGLVTSLIPWDGLNKKLGCK